MLCKICKKQTIAFGNGVYYLEDGKNILIPFFYCRNCNCFHRDVNEQAVISHLKRASHTNIKNENRFYHQRIGFFNYIFSIVKKHMSAPVSWLDFGCSFGHLIEVVQTNNILCDGMELNDTLREYLTNKGLSVYKNIDSLPPGKKYDVVSMIDSLYYCVEPGTLIRSLSKIMNKNGLLVIRVTNRNWLAKLRKRFFGTDLGLTLGDTTVGYSKKSLSYLLKGNGFKILQTANLEKGKALSINVRMFYMLSTLLRIVTLSLINLSPGLIVVARKGSND